MLEPVRTAPEADSPDTPAAAREAALDAAIALARRRVAPQWPLRDFVAVNPFVGELEHGFVGACVSWRRLAGVDLLMPRDHYREALAMGDVIDDDLRAALADAPANWPLPRDVALLRQALAADAPPAPAPVATVADLLDALAREQGQPSMHEFMVDEISRWCAAWFDEGEAAWPLPGRDAGLFAGWLEAMRHDRNAEWRGVTGFRANLATLPREPRAAIAAIVDELGMPDAALADYLQRALMDVAGWAAIARQRDDADGGQRLRDLLALRLSWGWTLYRVRRHEPAFVAAWQRAVADAVAGSHDTPQPDADQALRLVLQRACEIAERRRLLARLQPSVATATRPALQALFCIDVRSEVFRRALEVEVPQARTHGMAGFFGMAFALEGGGAQCPVLIRPDLMLPGGAVARAPSPLRRAWTQLRKRMGLAAVPAFPLVEATGLLQAASLVRDTWFPPAPHHDDARPDADAIPLATQVAMAEGMLRTASLVDGFARAVLVAGHRGACRNNPHAASLDCGACGGHGGAPNARLAADLLNRASVRAALAARGIAIPADTWFVAGEHDTTTDTLRLLDAPPASHAADAAALADALARAGSRARRERAVGLGLPADARGEAAIHGRARDWSQVRPEWGLAGNVALLLAPRALSRGASLDGRVFLHDYDRRADPESAVLEGLLTAPMVVASWINLQYYASSVAPARFGAGNKVLHNVTGGLGVLEGNGGDLRRGLPWQSVHDGRRLRHPPRRLCVLVAAPVQAIDEVLRRREDARALVEGGWLELLAVDDDGRALGRCRGAGDWVDA